MIDLALHLARERASRDDAELVVCSVYWSPRDVEGGSWRVRATLPGDVERTWLVVGPRVDARDLDIDEDALLEAAADSVRYWCEGDREVHLYAEIVGRP